MWHKQKKNVTKMDEIIKGVYNRWQKHIPLLTFANNNTFGHIMHIQVEEKESSQVPPLKLKEIPYSSNHICQPSHGIQCKKFPLMNAPSRRVWMHETIYAWWVAPPPPKKKKKKKKKKNQFDIILDFHRTKLYSYFSLKCIEY